MTSCYGTKNTTTLSPEVTSSSHVEFSQSKLGVDESCDRACWHGIEPGITSRRDAEFQLKQLYGVTGVQSTEYALEWVSNNVDISNSGGIDFSDADPDLVAVVTVNIKPRALTVEQTIKELGDPAWVRLIILPNFSREGNSTVCARVWLFYPDLGLEVHLRPDEEIIGLRLNQAVDTLGFVSLELSQARLLPQQNSVLVEWQGEQDYCHIFLSS